jgi:hypothetical protein
MSFAFNPLTGNFDLKGSGGGGGASYIDGEVATYTDLPLDGSAALNTAWLVREASGTWLIARKPAGIYIRTATAGVSRDADWTYAGILPDVFNDSNFLLYDNADSSKNLAFQLSGISASTTRTLTVPNSSGTIALLSNFLGAFKDAVVLAPSADMTKTSDVTLAAISGMSFTAAATTTYAALCYWQVDTGTGGFRMVLNVPSSFQSGASQSGYGINISGANVVSGVSTIGSDGLNIQSVTRGAAQTGPVFSIFAFRTTATSGTAEFRFSQNNSNATASVLKAESRVLVIPMTT